MIKSFVLSRNFGFSAQNYLFVYLLITAILEISSFALGLLKPEINVGLQYNLYNLFCIIYFTFFYRKLFHKNKVYILGLFFLSFDLLFIKFYSSEYSPELGLITAIFFVIISILWFIKKIKSKYEGKILEDAYFWVSTAILMWSVFFIFRVSPMYLFNKIDVEFLQILKIILNVVNIIMYLMFYLALIKFEKIANDLHKQ